MSVGVVTEEGVVNGQPYRVWTRRYDGKKIVYVGNDKRANGKTGRRRTARWLVKQKRLEAEAAGECAL